jgi:pyruvyltransferase
MLRGEAIAYATSNGRLTFDHEQTTEKSSASRNNQLRQTGRRHNAQNRRFQRRLTRDRPTKTRQEMGITPARYKPPQKSRHNHPEKCGMWDTKLVTKSQETTTLYQKVLGKTKREAIRTANLGSYMSLLNKPESHVAAYWSHSRNWGDALSPWLIERMYDRQPVNIARSYVPKGKPVLMAVGSVLGATLRNALVWGSGFISVDSQMKFAPKRVHALRGPLSLAKMERMGVSCPRVFGDPGLLVSRYYNPTVNRVGVGIVPHYVDALNPWIKRIRQSAECKIIDVLSPTEAFIDSINSCEIVISSSLHGIIAAEAYNIPALWVRLSSNIVGGDFKYNDYYEGTGRIPPKVVCIEPNTRLEDLVDRLSLWQGPRCDLDELFHAAPEM